MGNDGQNHKFAWLGLVFALMCLDTVLSHLTLLRSRICQMTVGWNKQ